MPNFSFEKIRISNNDFSLTLVFAPADDREVSRETGTRCRTGAGQKIMFRLDNYEPGYFDNLDVAIVRDVVMSSRDGSWPDIKVADEGTTVTLGMKNEHGSIAFEGEVYSPQSHNETATVFLTLVLPYPGDEKIMPLRGTLRPCATKGAASIWRRFAMIFGIVR